MRLAPPSPWRHAEGRPATRGAGVRAALAAALPPAFRWYVRRCPAHAGKSFLYRIVRHVAKDGPPLLAETRHGFPMRCEVGDLIQGYIYFFGVWEPDVAAFLARRLRPGDVFVDVGAHVGYHTLLGSRAVGPAGRVIAIEASPRNFALLRRNLELVSAGNVTAENVAAAAAKGTVSIYRAARRNSGETTIVPSRRGLFGERAFVKEAEVRAESFDEIVPLEDLRRARLVKIDVEGAEAPILARLLARVADLRPDAEILVELSADAPAAIAAFARADFNAYLVGNDYRFARYLRRDVSPPRRFRGTTVAQADVVFSRIDAETL